MNLHDDREVFEELIAGTANELAIPTNIIEKDYYVTIALKTLSEKIDDMVWYLREVLHLQNVISFWIGFRRI